MTRSSIMTPWGWSDRKETIAPGITFYSTPSHGGYELSPERNAALLAKFPGFRPFCGQAGWYEEDCDWAAVALAFPEHFPAAAIQHAQAMLPYLAKRMPAPPTRKPRHSMDDPAEPDYSGAFDGFQVTSDADPGL